MADALRAEGGEKGMWGWKWERGVWRTPMTSMDRLNAASWSPSRGFWYSEAKLHKKGGEAQAKRAEGSWVVQTKGEEERHAACERNMQGEAKRSFSGTG